MSISITVSLGDISVSGHVSGTEWDAELCTALGQRCVAALVDAVEVLSLTVPRLTQTP